MAAPGVEYDTDFRAYPERYRYTPDERGVFKVQPYKGELLPLWRFKDEEAAQASVQALLERFGEYREAGDFVGMDMARKYLQMGWTRAMRYAKYPGGRKRTPDGEPVEPQTWADDAKRRVALIFRQALDRVRQDQEYLRGKEEHLARQQLRSRFITLSA